MGFNCSDEILRSKPPRQIPDGTPADSPIRVIHALESRLKILDEKQQEVTSKYPDGPQRLRGLAGTGKTVLFTKRAAKIHKEHPDWRIAYVFFTRSLYDQIIKERISLYYRELSNGQKPNWDKIKVLHAWGAIDQDGFYRTLAQKCGIKPNSVRDVENKIGKVSPGEAFEYICNCLEKKVEEVPILYDAILIDEGQDLPFSFYRLACKTLSQPKRLYWAYDEAQGIGSLLVPKPTDIFVNHNGSDTNQCGIKKAHSFDNFNKCYRTPRLLLMTAHAVNMGLLREGGALQGVSNKKQWGERKNTGHITGLGYEVLEGDFSPSSVKAGKLIKITRPAETSPHPIDQEDFDLREALGTPLIIKTFSNEFQEQEWIAQQVANDLKQGLEPSDIMITALCGDYEKNYFRDLQAALKEYGVKSCIAGVDTNPNDFVKPGYVTLSNIYRAKGNEAWKVYACRLHYATRPLAFKQENELHKRNEAFVAITRARLWCMATGLEDPIFNELRKAKEQYPYLIFPAFNQKSLKRILDEQDDEAILQT